MANTSKQASQPLDNKPRRRRSTRSNKSQKKFVGRRNRGDRRKNQTIDEIGGDASAPVQSGPVQLLKTSRDIPLTSLAQSETDTKNSPSHPKLKNNKSSRHIFVVKNNKKRIVLLQNWNEKEEESCAALKEKTCELLKTGRRFLSHSYSQYFLHHISFSLSMTCHTTLLSYYISYFF